MSPRKTILTGASGFLGRHYLQTVGLESCVYALARRSPAISGAPTRPGVRWFQVDITRRDDLRSVFETIRDEGGADLLVHLAGHYDFTGERHPAYELTNVVGMRSVLEEAARLRVPHVVFASSLAACQFPGAGLALTEASPPDGDTPYGESKAAGERMLRGEFKDAFRACIVRFGAVYSDWCEYEPVYRFLETWLSGSVASRLLGGCGASAVPYLHVRDAMAFLHVLRRRLDDLEPGEIVVASPDGAVSHRELFEIATAAHFGQRSQPMTVPKSLCRPGLWMRDLAGQTLGVRPFERAWMARMIDKQLTVDGSRTRRRVNWAPRQRFSILHRLPFLVQNRKTFPAEWHRRNHGAVKHHRAHENLTIHRLLERHAPDLSESLAARWAVRHGGSVPANPSRRVAAQQHLLLEALMNAVRTGEKGTFMGACRELAELEREHGTSLEDLCDEVADLSEVCLPVLLPAEPGTRWRLALYDHIAMTVQFGIDEIHDVYEDIDS